MAQNRLSNIRWRMAAVDYLAEVKKNTSYRQLQEHLELGASVMSRYVTGRVLPSDSKARKIVKVLSRLYGVSSLILSNVSVDADGLVDDTGIISSPKLLRLAATEAYASLADVKPDKVVTMAADGIGYAVMLADLMDARVVVAKKEREKGVKKFVYAEVGVGDSGLSVGAYVPAGMISKRDVCLIVDDLVRTGETQRALGLLVKKAGGTVAGYSFLISIGDKWKGMLEPAAKVHLAASLKADRAVGKVTRTR
ncbi:MAG: hypothetical protein QW767_06245 [Thermoprotei archaeon]